MTAPVPDPREPKPCPRCGTVCVHDGWGHVHPNGIGIGSCAVPDPRFRDHDVVVEIYDGVDISMRCISCRERIAVRPESAAASLHELQRLAEDHVRRVVGTP